MDPRILLVVNNLRPMLQEDGADAVVLGLDGSKLRVRYKLPTKDCGDHCSMGPFQFKELLKAQLEVQAPQVKEIEIVTEG